jgi:hypothetical protein
MVEQATKSQIIIPSRGKAQREDCPLDIANRLEKEHGLAEALSIVAICKLDASQTTDYYALSIWREISVLLKDRTECIDSD